MWVVSSQARAELIDPENKEILVKAEFKFHKHLRSHLYLNLCHGGTKEVDTHRADTKGSSHDIGHKISK